MLLVGYCLGIRSERRLCEEVHLNLAYRWFCRLGLDGAVPDHSTFSKNRHGRFRDSDLLRELFETTVARCIAEGLVGGEGFAVDASMIKADANRQRSVPGSEGLPPEAASHAVREYLAVLDEAAFGGATPVTPKFISIADPASRWTGANGGLAFFAYCTNYLIDLKHAVIMDVEATTAVRQAEVTAQRRMLDRTQERFGIWPERLAADTGYGDAANLAWLVHERGIEPHIPVFEKSRTDGSFGRTDFTYDHETDSYTCPGGKQLRQFWQQGRAAKAKPPADGIYKYPRTLLLAAALLPLALAGPATMVSAIQPGGQVPAEDVWQPARTPRGGTSWRLLETTRLDDRTDPSTRLIYTKPIFPPAIRALAGKRVKVAGWMMPLENGIQQKYFVLLGYPPGCPFHMHALPNQFIEVFAAVPIRVDERNPTVISGTLELTGHDESGVFYRLRNARPG